MSTVNALTFSALRMANERRQAEWPGNDQIDKAFRALETAGEGGELAEAIEVHLRTSLMSLATIGSLGRISEQMKKFLRAERGIKGSTADVADIAREMGDCMVALDLLADELGIDLGDATAAKFNETSEKYGLKTRIPVQPLLQVFGFSKANAENLLECFGGEETDMTLSFFRDGHSGPGFYAWCTQYPEDGCEYLGPASEHSFLSLVKEMETENV